MAGGYVIFGKTFQAYQLSYATLSLVGAGILLATSGKKEAKPAPAINAQSPQEEDFITQFLKDAEEKK